MHKKKRFEKSLFLIFAIAILPPFFLCRPSLAAISEEMRLEEQEKIKELEKLKAEPQKGKKVSVKFGFWFSTTYRDYKNLDNDETLDDLVKYTWLQDARLWMNMTFLDKHSAYVRIKDYYLRRGVGDGYTGIGDDNKGPELDMGYFRLNFRDNKYLSGDLAVGRQYIYLGRGITYSNIHDGVRLNAYFKKCFLKLFYTRNKPREDNIDVTVPGYDKQGKREFIGGEIAYTTLKNFVTYAYFLLQHDREDENTPQQNYNYNSQYIGAGFEGRLFNKKLEYWFEAIKEFGTSYTDTLLVPLAKKDVDAWALDAGVRYRWKHVLKPSLELEYAFGSGDKDRLFVTDTQGGNMEGKDKNFLYFGDFFAGYALAPRLSNLHIWKIDFSLKPFNYFKFGKNITAGLKYYVYRKDKPAGGIYDEEGWANSHDVGTEANGYFYWKLYKNIYLSSRYGIFFPGGAYADSQNNSTKYFYTSIILTF